MTWSGRELRYCGGGCPPWKSTVGKSNKDNLTDCVKKDWTMAPNRKRKKQQTRATASKKRGGSSTGRSGGTRKKIKETESILETAAPEAVEHTETSHSEERQEKALEEEPVSNENVEADDDQFDDGGDDVGEEDGQPAGDDNNDPSDNEEDSEDDEESDDERHDEEGKFRLLIVRGIALVNMYSTQ